MSAGRDPECVCCHLHYGGKTAACGHWFCELCIGRGHDEDCPICEPWNPAHLADQPDEEVGS